MIAKAYIITLSWFLCAIIPATVFKNNPSATIPLKQVGHLFIIEADIDGQGGNFIFDTGATKLVLNKTYFRTYMKADRRAGGISGTGAEIGHTKVKQLDFAGISLKNLNADVVSLGHIENKRGIRVLGLIGMEVLKEYEMTIDFRNQTLILHPIDRKGNKLNPEHADFRADLTCKVRARSDVMYIKAEMGQQTLDFCLDTGAESNVICSSCRKDILSTVTINRRTTLSGMGGQSIEVLYGLMNDFNLMDTSFEPMQAIITSLAALSDSYDFPVDGVLGYDFFAKGIININLGKQELGIKFYKTAK